ncbi:hypothetical protein B0H14DRAFT_3872701 [Mycena olivaceomarginata]|nr:hypothetical protein B0H14DRAFT_3872701 [Mycena olivaceomarginata]
MMVKSKSKPRPARPVVAVPHHFLRLLLHPSPHLPPPISPTPSPSSKLPTFPLHLPLPRPSPALQYLIQFLQSSLPVMLRAVAAWGLIVPLLAHEDANVQFPGAHTPHAKIARGELALLPVQEHAESWRRGRERGWLGRGRVGWEGWKG